MIINNRHGRVRTNDNSVLQGDFQRIKPNPQLHNDLTKLTLGKISSFSGPYVILSNKTNIEFHYTSGQPISLSPQQIKSIVAYGWFKTFPHPNAPHKLILAFTQISNVSEILERKENPPPNTTLPIDEHFDLFYLFLLKATEASISVRRINSGETVQSINEKNWFVTSQLLFSAETEERAHIEKLAGMSPKNTKD